MNELIVAVNLKKWLTGLTLGNLWWI